MKQNLQEERVANAKRTSPELLAMRKSESRQAAIHAQFTQFGTEILDGNASGDVTEQSYNLVVLAWRQST